MIIIEFWKQVAIYDLRRFNSLQASVKSMQEQVDSINTRLEGSAYSFSSTPVQGGSCKLEDKYNEAIVLKDKLQCQIAENEKDYILISRALEKLSKDEQKILNYAYISRPSNYIGVIMDTFNVEQAQAYNHINKALKNYVRTRYGV
ncbi:MAG: DUF1492 domain-containing protein [Ruminococcaceae bacterium]|nr:DUF1492 domain-containing protein [Oscillospiraceae bacterium]